MAKCPVDGSDLLSVVDPNSLLPTGDAFCPRCGYETRKLIEPRGIRSKVSGEDLVPSSIDGLRRWKLQPFRPFPRPIFYSDVVNSKGGWRSALEKGNDMIVMTRVVMYKCGAVEYAAWARN